MKKAQMIVGLVLLVAIAGAWGERPGLFVQGMQLRKGGGSGWSAMALNLEPREAVQAGGRWDRVTGTNSFSASNADNAIDRVPYLGAGTYHVTFRAIPDWETPAPVEFTINSSEAGPSSISARYGHPSGTLRVTIKPDELARAGARWAIQAMDAPWKQSGEAIHSVVGTYNLLFDRFDTAQWNPPDHMSVTITRNNTASVTATFTRK
jgi:hypothetical protein